MEPTPADPPIPPARPRRPWTLLGRLEKAVREQNWFAVVLELVIVVLGVVIGFQVTAWGQERSDGAKEQVYLRQLARDLAETERIVADAEVDMGPNRRALIRLLHSFGAPEPPPRDTTISMLSLALGFYPVQPVTGTAEALVATGDLALIRNDSLRNAVAQYVQATRAAMRLSQASGEEVTGALSAVFDRIDYIETRAQSPPAYRDSLARANPSSLDPPGWWQSPFPLDVEAFMRDRSAYSALQALAAWRQNQVVVRRSYGTLAEALREQVDADLNR